MKKLNGWWVIKFLINCLFAIGITIGFILIVGDMESNDLGLFFTVKIGAMLVFAVLVRVCIWFNRNYSINEES